MSQQGDVVSAISSVVSGGALDIQPPSGNEWVIHNIYYGGPMLAFKTDGTNSIQFDYDNTSGGRLGTVFHCTHSVWVRVQNNSSSSSLIGYDGIQTK